LGKAPGNVKHSQSLAPCCGLAVRRPEHSRAHFAASARSRSTSRTMAHVSRSPGGCVSSPTVTADERPAEGATAYCRDGTFSFSHTRQGNCSHHGGVAVTSSPGV